MISNLALMLEVFSTSINSSVIEECCEFLYLVLTASDNGIVKFCEFSGVKILALRLRSLQDSLQDDDSRLVEMCIRLFKFIIRKISLDTMQRDYLFEFSIIVSAMARQFAILHNSLKFEALHVLNSVVCSTDSSQFVKILEDSSWSHDIRVGIMAILQNRVDPAKRLQALILAESMVSIFGEDWLIISQVSKTDDMCLLLVLEQSRVEIAVLLNDLAYLKYEVPQDDTPIDVYSLKQRNVAVAYSLVERIIKLISNVGENDMNVFDEGTLTKVILQLYDTITVVLAYLEDAKEHGQRKGDDLLASVRIIGSYLAEAPDACNEKVRDLLGYMLSIEGEDEQRPFQSVCFLLPMLCQTTMKVEGCKALASCGGALKAVLDCLSKLIGSKRYSVEDDSCIFLACDTIMNLLLKKDEVQLMLDESAFVELLKALAYWSKNTDNMSDMTMASSICALIFDYTSEEALLNHPDFNHGTLSSLYQLIARCMASSKQDTNTDMDLYEIIYAGFYRWYHRYPKIREEIKLGFLFY